MRRSRRNIASSRTLPRIITRDRRIAICWRSSSGICRAMALALRLTRRRRHPSRIERRVLVVIDGGCAGALAGQHCGLTLMLLQGWQSLLRESCELRVADGSSVLKQDDGLVVGLCHLPA